VPREKAPQVHAATYVAETRTIDSLPPVGPPEIAIAGRSNVGKSTLLNRLAGRLKLARTSKTPGRTRGIVFYDLRVGTAAGPRELRLADLPGFGYAKVSQAERASWQPLIEGYVERRPTLALFVVLVDSRRGVAAEEEQLLEWLAALRMPAQVVFTKVDKLSATEKGGLKASSRAQLQGVGLRPLLISAESGDGVDDLWAAIFRALPGETEPDAGEIAAPKTPA
jgi:GTP-binding protein